MPITSHRPPTGQGRRARRLLLAAVTAAALVTGGLVTAGAADAAPADTSLNVSNASFAWGLSDQANIYQYGQCNFLSAGTAGDNGASVAWSTDAPTPGYQAADGNVSILKPGTGGALVPVDGTLADACTDANGTTLASGAASGSVVDFANGTGTVDPGANTASISWSGSFTSVFYNGLVYWSAANPTLTVAADGTGTLTATVSGYGAPRGATPAWVPVAATTATLATLHGVKVTTDGFTVTPDFAGVVDTSAGTTQKQTAPNWGSWPQSLITFLNPVGIAPFFYTSAATDQPVKEPLPIAFAYTPTSDPISSDHVSLAWAGNREIQSAPPFGGSNYLSAGVSDGTQASYQADAGDVHIVQRASDGATVPASYATRAAFIAGDGTQLVELDNGHATLAADGSGTVDWSGSFSVNFYGGLVPFTVTDPELTVQADGDATLTGTLSGVAASMSNPGETTPLPSQPDTVIANFANVHLGIGDNTLAPDYAGVAITIPSGQTAQDTTSAGWGSWPQSWVDYQFQTGLSSYWYSSGGAADAKKAPSAVTVSVPATDTVPGDGDGTTPGDGTGTTPPPSDDQGAGNPAPTPTLSAAAPTIAGTVKVGSTLNVKPGTWSPVAVTKKFQWYASGKAIAGATKSTLALKAAQYGTTITVKVTGSAAGYPSLVEQSKATKKVSAGALHTATPKISGSAKVGKKLTAKPGSWTSGTKLSYQWFAGTKAVKGATKASFTVKATQKGKTIKVKVTGKRTGYVTTAKVSKNTKKVVE